MTTFHPVSVGLSNGQEKKLQFAMRNGNAISIKLKPENLVGDHQLMVTQTQMNALNKATSKGKGIVLKFSQNQIRKTGGSLLGLATAALPMAAKALGLAGLSFGAEKALKKIFGSGIPPGAVELYHLIGKPSPAQKKAIKNALVGQGIVGSGQRGGFLGLLASLGIPLAISLVKKVLGKGMRLQPSGKGMRLQPSGKGMRLQPPPIVGSWKKNSWTFP